MSGRRRFSELTAKMPPERLARIDELIEKIRKETDISSQKAKLVDDRAKPRQS